MINDLKNYFSFNVTLRFIVASLIMLSSARIGLMLLYLSRIDYQVINTLLLQGIRFDVITVFGLTAFGFLLQLCTAWLRPMQIFVQKVLVVYFTTCFVALLFMELSTPSFISQFDIRPNYLFVEYLDAPVEVGNTLIKAYWGPLIVTAIVIPLLGFTANRYIRAGIKAEYSKKLFYAFAPIVFLILALGIRSTLSHRPANPSLVALTSDPMVNSLALNSTYSTLYAIYSSVSHESGDLNYGEVSDAVYQNFIEQERAIHELTKVDFDGENSKPKNLVIILEESLGAEFVGSLGGLDLTPNLDTLSKEGIWFDQMYATGTRSVRGIEAVITGFLPTPARSVVKLPKAQTGFFTIAELLSQQGYDTSFIYGGEAHFDNMRNFFTGNGFNKIIEQKDYVKPTFVGSWGVSDEDLFDKADIYFKSQGDKPFFSLVFSSSNHSPFEYPEGKIEPYDKEPATVNNAVKYADHAIGQLIKKAKASPYWDNTVFLIVADHNSRVYGDALVPIERFHIPALILGGGIEPQTLSKISSQIDLIPTLLPLIGVEDSTPCLGRNLLSPEIASLPGRAIMQFNAIQAYRENDKVVVLRDHLQPEVFDYRNKKLIPLEGFKPSLIEKALAFSMYGPKTYNDKSYQLNFKNLPLSLSQVQH